LGARDRMELAANDAYWNGKPAIARIVLRFIPTRTRNSSGCAPASSTACS